MQCTNCKNRHFFDIFVETAVLPLLLLFALARRLPATRAHTGLGSA